MRETLALTTGWCKKRVAHAELSIIQSPYTSHPHPWKTRGISIPVVYPQNSEIIQTYPHALCLSVKMHNFAACLSASVSKDIIGAIAMQFYLICCRPIPSVYLVRTVQYCHTVWCIIMPADPWKFITVLVPIPYPYRWESPWEFTYYGSPGILVLDVNFLNTYICQTINRRKNLWTSICI